MVWYGRKIVNKAKKSPNVAIKISLVWHLHMMHIRINNWSLFLRKIVEQSKKMMNEIYFFKDSVLYWPKTVAAFFLFLKNLGFCLQNPQLSPALFQTSCKRWTRFSKSHPRVWSQYLDPYKFLCGESGISYLINLTSSAPSHAHTSEWRLPLSDLLLAIVNKEADNEEGLRG